MPSDISDRSVLVWEKADGERVSVVTINSGDAVQIGDSDPLVVTDSPRPRWRGSKVRMRWAAAVLLGAGVLATAALPRGSSTAAPAVRSTGDHELPSNGSDTDPPADPRIVADTVQRATTSGLRPSDVLLEEGLPQQQ